VGQQIRRAAGISHIQTLITINLGKATLMDAKTKATLRTANLLGALAGAVADQLERPQKDHHNQTNTSLAALNLLDAFAGCSNLQLSRAMKLSHSATVRLLDKLDAVGWVRREPGQDRRSVTLWLTPAGKTRVRQTARERAAVLRDITQLLNAQQRQHLDGIAQTLLRSMATSEWEAAYLCRLCDDGACPAQTCPVHQALTPRTSV
jgi:MarR family transcriptional regulator, negative regulator of the multidrug operon emrRAB